MCKVVYGTFILCPAPSFHFHSPPDLSVEVCVHGCLRLAWKSHYNVPVQVTLHPHPRLATSQLSSNHPSHFSLPAGGLSSFSLKKNRSNQTRRASSSRSPRHPASAFPPTAVVQLSLPLTCANSSPPPQY